MINREFNPSISHPYYFIRRGILLKVREHSKEITGRTLDFGCGSKPYRSLFSSSEYIGIDFENPGHPHDKEQVDVFYDGRSIPFPDAHFDSAFSTEVFEHLFNIEEILDELNRVLKPGGKMLITCPFVWPEHEKPHDFARYTQFALKALLEKKGFTVNKIEKTGDFLTAVFQLRIMYVHDVFLPKLTVPLFIKWARMIVIPVMTLVCRALRKIFPSNKDLYLSNIVIAQKN
jgi:SAM-dependent methyltransferase